MSIKKYEITRSRFSDASVYSTTQVPKGLKRVIFSVALLMIMYNEIIIADAEGKETAWTEDQWYDFDPSGALGDADPLTQYLKTKFIRPKSLKCLEINKTYNSTFDVRLTRAHVDEIKKRTQVVAEEGKNVDLRWFAPESSETFLSESCGFA